MSKIITSLGKQVHGVSDQLIEARILEWMMREANGGNWWLLGVTHDGKVIAWDNGAGVQTGLQPPRDREHYALAVLSALNLELAQGGTWMVAWIDDCRRFYLLWRDADGDIQIPIDCDRSWLRFREWGVDVWLRMAGGAWQQWTEIQQNLELRPDQTVRLAAGEAPKQVH